jgi:hypothetical protein
VFLLLNTLKINGLRKKYKVNYNNVVLYLAFMNGGLCSSGVALCGLCVVKL